MDHRPICPQHWPAPSRVPLLAEHGRWEAVLEVLQELARGPRSDLSLPFSKMQGWDWVADLP